MHKIQVGATSQSILLFVQDASDAQGKGLTGLTHATSGLACGTVRLAYAAADLTLVSQTPAGAWVSGGFCEIDAVRLPGRYRLDLPNALLAIGTNEAAVQLRGVTNMIHEPVDIRLTRTSDQDVNAGGMQYVNLLAGMDIVLTGLGGYVSSGVHLANSERIYHATIDLAIDDDNARDEYTVRFFKDLVRQTAGITSPTIQIIKRADGTDLLAETALTQIGSTGAYKYDATTTARVTKGEAALAVIRATIDGSTRTMERIVSRDT